MKIKRFFAKDMRTALNEVKEELGADAVIMSNKKLADGVEIVAAIDNDRTAAPVQQPTTGRASAPKETQTRFVRPEPRQAQPAKQAQVADSLEALLERQAPRPRSPELASMFSQSGIDTEQMLGNQRKMQPEAKPTYRSAPQTHRQSFDFEDEATEQSKPWGESDDLDNGFGDDLTEVHSKKDEMSAMREEMNSIRQLLEHQVSGLMKQEMARRDPTRACLVDRLEGMGIDKEVAEQMACFIPDDVSRKEAWSALLNMVINQMHTTNNDILRQGGVFAMVGPTGVGKTTTVAKLAALGAQKYGADKVALITTDTYRIGAYEQLATYGRIIGCPVKQVKDANELAEVLYHLRNKRLVLIDTAGMSQRDLRLTEQLNTLMRSARVDIRSYLVLSATSQMNVLQETVRHFQKVNLSGCIFTKLDESLSLGEIISIAIQNRLPIGYLTNGQRVPEDIRVANAQKLVKKAEQLYLKRIKAQHSRRVPVASESVGMYD
ncbi:flagellar biosynthesis protein FlhF [Pseudoalteromonas sp. McH1-7]|uniref:Flagellar biosynthesis protein FlhF n=1 Tax=Pseudoalteromonas peptidolytica F12-50-A1 TaxID=1315280 RepID=A0A8I0MXE2_9GAMM|nr:MULTISPECIES: flagellar biosynthesis protein FlhF [Pseudoalteromonas]MBE0346844.1 flagellar biosynthesis protein FlhF [Pseudoalteromonas peptidolytica F12-50-A1]MDW7550013.1 flagellar biosynthesis protein FlhF [Pseudoalteromonas peptidolytica]NLR13747.1 flagellar biosynthesis protein FlhF [Pseudoalteromonas peptidolytica]NUZ09552.1 flagellar biosynthesis protein FlhF [Pseudoalteromonas sp. McH1-7]RRS08992.1 flagellar biosynthesis protein FlhF [Pseudoalteromonas sp. J010]